MVQINQGYPPMPPPQFSPGLIQAPQIINMGGGGGGGTHCIACQRPTESVSRKTMGCVSWAWVITLLFIAPIFSCIPCCCEGCKDTEVVCTTPGCAYVKNKIPGQCCCG